MQYIHAEWKLNILHRWWSRLNDKSQKRNILQFIPCHRYYKQSNFFSYSTASDSSVSIFPSLCVVTVNVRSVSRQNNKMAAGGRFVLQGFCSEVSAGLLTTYVLADYARLRLKARVFFFKLTCRKNNPRRIFHDISEAAKNWSRSWSN